MTERLPVKILVTYYFFMKKDFSGKIKSLVEIFFLEGRFATIKGFTIKLATDTSCNILRMGCLQVKTH